MNKLIYVLLYSILFSSSLFSFDYDINNDGRRTAQAFSCDEAFAFIYTDLSEYSIESTTSYCPVQAGEVYATSAKKELIFGETSCSRVTPDDYVPAKFEAIQLFTSGKNCEYPCEEQNPPPESPFTTVIFNYALDDDGNMPYPFEMEELCLNSTLKAQHLPGQYQINKTVCWQSSCADKPTIILYSQLDPNYQPDGDGDSDGIPNKCDPDNPDIAKYDCDGDSENNTQDPDFDLTGDGLLNKCDPDHELFKSFDCDGDGETNWGDTDIDGDGLQNEYDNHATSPLTGDQIEGMPTCEEIEAINKLKCPINQHDFDCFGFPPNIRKDECKDIYGSPCDDYLTSLEKSCGIGYHVEGNCQDNGVQTTSNSYKCLPTPDPKPNCRASDNKQLNQFEDACECIDGYTINSFGNCWLSELDENSTQAEITKDKQKQAEQNEEIENKNQAELQAETDNNRTSQQLSNTETTNDTLSGIRSDLNKTNELLKSLTENNPDNPENIEIVEDAELTDLLNQKKDLLETMVGQYSTFGTNINQHFTDIQDKFAETKSLFSSSQTFTIDSGSTSNCLSFQWHGETISFDLCTYLGIISPFIYFIFTIGFMALTFKFMVTNLLKGLD